MSDFPKWMLALTGINLLPALLCVFYLFGVSTAGVSDSAFLRFLAYVGIQLLWLVPLLLFFFSLDFYRRGFERIGISLAVLGIIVGGAGFVAVFF